MEESESLSGSSFSPLNASCGTLRFTGLSLVKQAFRSLAISDTPNDFFPTLLRHYVRRKCLESDTSKDQVTFTVGTVGQA